MRAPRRLTAGAGLRRQAGSGPAVAMIGVLVAAVAGGFASFSPGAEVLVLAVGGTLFWVGLARPADDPPEAPRRLPPAARWWLVPVLGVLVVEAVTFGLGSTDDYPTLSRLADPLLERYPVRAAAFLGWSGVFWALSRR